MKNEKITAEFRERFFFTDFEADVAFSRAGTRDEKRELREGECYLGYQTILHYGSTLSLRERRIFDGAASGCGENWVIVSQGKKV